VCEGQSMQVSTNSLKRKISETSDSNKRIKRAFPINTIPKDLLYKILLSLNNLSIVSFAATSKSATLALDGFWEIKKIEDRYNFKWKMTQEESNSHKWDYYLSCAIHQYIVIDKYPLIKSPNLKLAQDIHKKFDGLIKHFP